MYSFGRSVSKVALLSTTAADPGEFIERVKTFEREAWDQLYEEFYPRMYRYLYVHVGDRSEAEELAARVFEQACKGIRRFRYRGVPLSSWLYRIAHDLMVDWQRRRGRRRETPVSGDIAAADSFSNLETRDELQRAMSRLTAEQREVLVLRHIEGHSSASAGELMGKGGNAVRALEFRALAALRRALAADEGKGR
jgi:RNA polymerase sigma-70 factor (ECF subfamily)